MIRAVLLAVLIATPALAVEDDCRNPSAVWSCRSASPRCVPVLIVDTCTRPDGSTYARPLPPPMDIRPDWLRDRL